MATSGKQDEQQQDVALDFHRAFLAIDTDHSGEITIEELQNYCSKMNYQKTFVQKWLTLFDADQNGRITYSEYCDALGLSPKKDVVARHKAQSKKAPAGKKSGQKGVKRRKEQQQQQPEEEMEVPPVETVEAASAAKTFASIAPPAAPAAAAAADADKKQERQRRQRNQPVSTRGGSLMRYSRARVFQRKALYRLAKEAPAGAASQRRRRGGCAKRATKKPTAATKTAAVVEKPIGGERNGGTRQVATRRLARSLPTETPPRRLQRRPKRTFAEHRRRLRPSIRPGSVLVLLAGRHRGKRVVCLKQLASGLLLVTGPLRVNGCPLRRVCQSFVLSTRTRLGLEGLRLPERVNDQYFRRRKRLSKKLAKSGGDSADLFARQRPEYQLSQERREDQQVVDAQVMATIRASEDKKMMLGYLGSLFCLKSGQKPHEMLF